MEWSDRIGRRIRLRDLHILLAVEQCGSLAKAAELLAISQPVISKVIADLEAVLGVRLFDRGRHGAEPTMYGRALLRRAVAAFDELKQGVGEIGFMLDPTSGRLRIGAADPMVAGLIPAVIERMSAGHPDVTFEVLVAESVLEQNRGLHDRSVDLIIGRLPQTFADEDLDIQLLFEEPLLVATGAKSRWAKRRAVSLADLVDEPWVLPRSDTFVGSLVTEAFRAEGLALPQRGVTCGSTHMNNAMLATGRYLAVYPGSLLRLTAKRLGIAVLPIKLRIGPSSVGVVTLKQRTISPLAQLFVDAAREVARSLRFADPTSGVGRRAQAKEVKPRPKQ